MARVSVESLSEVDVPCATIQSTSSGATPLLRSALVIARVWPRPVGSGAEMWNASAVSAPPRAGATQVALEELFERSDVIALAAKTVTEGPRRNVGMIGSVQLSRARSAIVVNLANPLLVDTPAMVQALAAGNVAAYSVESSDRKAFGDDPRVHCPPANAWDSDESMASLRATWVSNVLSAIRGKPENAYRE